MIPKEKFEVEKTTIGKLLSEDNVLYRISRFQRPYAWGLKQQEELLKDIVNAIKKVGNNETTDIFFMGNFIFQPYNSKEGNEIMNIVDGQQRLITITMILANIRNNLFQIYKNKRINIEIRNKANKLKEDVSKLIYLLDEGQNKPIITPHEELEKKYFFENILHLNEEKIHEIKIPENSSGKNYYDGYNMLQDNMVNYMENKNSSKKVEFLGTVFNQIKNSTVVMLKISNEEHAYNIYSNINSKGLYLSPIDLIKNDFLYKTDKLNSTPGVDKQLELWNRIFENVKYNSTIPFDEYYKYCWYMIHSEDFPEYFESDASLFEIFQTKYPKENSSSSINKFFKELLTQSKKITDFKQANNVNEWRGVPWKPMVEKLTFAADVSDDSVTNNYPLWLLPLQYKSLNNKSFKLGIEFVTDTIFIYKLLLIYGAEKDNTLNLLEDFFDKIFERYSCLENDNGFAINPVIDELKIERSSILKEAQANIISIISSLKYTKNRVYILYLMRRLNDEKGIVLGNYIGSIEHIIEAEYGTNASDSIGNIVLLEKTFNDEAAEEKNNLQKEYKQLKLKEELLIQKFDKIYRKSSYPEVKKLIEAYSPVDFNEKAVEERSISIAEDYFKEFLNA